MQSYTDTSPSPTPTDDSASYCDYYDPRADGCPSMIPWQAGTSDPPAVQQYECSSSLDILEPRAEEDGTDIARGRVLPPGVGFSQSGPAAGNPLHSFSWSSQFADPSRYYDQIIKVDQQTRCKAERHPDTQVIVYQCKWDAHGSTCEQWIEGGIREIRIHLRKEHGIQGQVKDRIRCKWLGCAEEFKYGSIPRHVMTHLKVTFRCSNCDTKFPRDDRIKNHCRIVGECANAESVLVPGPGARLIRTGSYGV